MFPKLRWNFTKRCKGILNISGNSHKRRLSLKTGSKVSVEDVWMHPRYNPITSANNLALVKLECRDITLHINADLRHTNCSVPMNCSTTGYLHSSKNRLRSREQHWEIDRHRRKYNPVTLLCKARHGCYLFLYKSASCCLLA